MNTTKVINIINTNTTTGPLFPLLLPLLLLPCPRRLMLCPQHSSSACKSCAASKSLAVFGRLLLVLLLMPPPPPPLPYALLTPATTYSAKTHKYTDKSSSKKRNHEYAHDRHLGKHQSHTTHNCYRATNPHRYNMNSTLQQARK